MAEEKAVPKAPQVRFRVDPAYAPAEKIARHLCLTLEQFRTCAHRLYARGFPLPDETTGMYHLESVERWSKRQRPDLFPELAFSVERLHVSPTKMSLGEKSRQAHELRRADRVQRQDLVELDREARERLRAERSATLRHGKSRKGPA